MMTALRARMLSLVPLLSTAMPRTRPELRLLPIDRDHLVLEQIFDAGLAGGGVERLHQPVAGRHGRALVRVGRRAGLDQRPIHRRAVHRAQHRIADRRAALAVRRLVDEHDAMLAQELEGGGAVVGEGADDLAVIVAVIRESRWAATTDQSVRSSNTRSGESSMP